MVQRVSVGRSRWWFGELQQVLGQGATQKSSWAGFLFGQMVGMAGWAFGKAVVMGGMKHSFKGQSQTVAPVECCNGAGFCRRSDAAEGTGDGC